MKNIMANNPLDISIMNKLTILKKLPYVNNF